MLDAERRNRTALWARLERDGYLLLRGAISPLASVEFRRDYFARLQASGLLEPGSDPALGIALRLEFDRATVRRALFEEIVPSAVYAGFCNALSGFFSGCFAQIFAFNLPSSRSTHAGNGTGATTTGCERLKPHWGGVQSDPCAALTWETLT